MNTPTEKLACFKAYDIRGKMPHELNETVAYWVGHGVATVTGAKTAVLGMDSRLSSPALLDAVAAGLAAAGCKPKSLGMCGTEETYFAAGVGMADVSVMVTASHNPAEYNGMKFLKKNGVPFSHDVDMPALETHVRNHLETPITGPSSLIPEPVDLREAYVQHVLALVDVAGIKPCKIVINAGHGAAGPTADAILKHLPQLQVVRLYHNPDGTFPAGIPNPLLPENRTPTINAVKEHGAQLGVAWDGDFDRCFLYDEQGNFISNYYLAGLLARTMLQREAGATIVHDPRQYWDTVDLIQSLGGKAVMSRVGHGYIKPDMRATGAIFSGEVSGHFYFRDFFTCDTGMLPWLLILQLMSQTGKPLSELVAERIANAPSSDEINFRTTAPAKSIMEQLRTTYATQGAAVETIDGVGLTFPMWRCNIRSSSNEPLLRLNVEARDATTLNAKLAELTTTIQSLGATLSNH